MNHTGNNSIHVQEFFSTLVKLRKRYDKAELPSKEIVIRTMEYFNRVAKANDADSNFRMREWRRRKKREGMCPACGARPAIPGYVLCGKCRDYQRDYRRRRSREATC